MSGGHIPAPSPAPSPWQVPLWRWRGHPWAGGRQPEQSWGRAGTSLAVAMPGTAADPTQEFWGCRSHTGILGLHIPHTREFLGLHIPHRWEFWGSRSHTGILGLKTPHRQEVLGLYIPHGSFGAADPTHTGVLGLQIPHRSFGAQRGRVCSELWPEGFQTFSCLFQPLPSPSPSPGVGLSPSLGAAVPRMSLPVTSEDKAAGGSVTLR